MNKLKQKNVFFFNLLILFSILCIRGTSYCVTSVIAIPPRPLVITYILI